MGFQSFDSFISVSDVLGSTRADNGAITLQIGEVVSGNVERGAAELYGVPGIISAPANPSSTQARAEVVHLKYGDRSLCIAARDVVSQSIGGALNPGETCIYAPGAEAEGQARILLKDDGATSSITAYTTVGNASGGESVAISLTSAPSFAVALGSVGGLTFDETGFKLICGNVGIMGDAVTGVLTFMGKEIQIAGQKVMLGIGALPTNTINYGPGGAAGAFAAIASTSVLVAA